MVNITPPTLAIVCNGNARTGYGHFYRCLHIARSLKRQFGIALSWIGDLDDTLVSLLQCNEEQYLYAVDIDKACEIATQSAASAVVCDSYAISSLHIEQLSSRHPVCAIDDFCNIDFQKATCVLNFTVSADSYQYHAKQVLAGPGYFLCDSRLDKVRAQNISRLSATVNSMPDNIRILIAIGGHDRKNIGVTLASHLAQADGRFHITLLGPYEAIDYQNILLIPRTQNMASLYSKADLVISGGGLIKYESAYCGIPNMVFAQTLEQYEESKAFASRELCVIGGMASETNGFSLTTQDLAALADRAIKGKQALIRASVMTFRDNSTDHAATALYRQLFLSENLDERND